MQASPSNVAEEKHAHEPIGSADRDWGHDEAVPACGAYQFYHKKDMEGMDWTICSCAVIPAAVIRTVE